MTQSYRDVGSQPLSKLLILRGLKVLMRHRCRPAVANARRPVPVAGTTVPGGSRQSRRDHSLDCAHWSNPANLSDES